MMRGRGMTSEHFGEQIAFAGFRQPLRPPVGHVPVVVLGDPT